MIHDEHVYLSFYDDDYMYTYPISTVVQRALASFLLESLILCFDFFSRFSPHRF